MSIARTKYKVTKSLLLLGILCTGLLSGFIGLVAYFGQYMGTFVIALDDTAMTLGITLADNPDFNDPSSRLLVNPVSNANATTISEIKFKDIVNSNGDYNPGGDNSYIAYTFYLKNESDVSVDILLNMDIVSVTNNVDSAVRIMLLEDGYVDEETNKLEFSTGSLYIKDQLNQDDNALEVLDPDVREFYDNLDKVIFNNESVLEDYLIDNLRPDRVRKYSLIIWLEGFDDDCTDALKQGQLKMKMNFSIRNIVEEDENN